MPRKHLRAASSAKRVASQKSPCKNEERRKEEEETGERYRLKTVKSGSTLSPVQAGEADSWLFSFSLSLSLSLSLFVFWTPNPIKGGCAGSEKRSAWRIAAAVRSPRRFVNRPIALVPVREPRRHHRRCCCRRRRRPAAKMPQKSAATRSGYPTSRSVPAGCEPRGGGRRRAKCPSGTAFRFRYQVFRYSRCPPSLRTRAQNGGL